MTWLVTFSFCSIYLFLVFRICISSTFSVLRPIHFTSTFLAKRYLQRVDLEHIIFWFKYSRGPGYSNFAGPGRVRVPKFWTLAGPVGSRSRIFAGNFCCVPGEPCRALLIRTQFFGQPWSDPKHHILGGSQDKNWYTYDGRETRFSPDISPIILASQVNRYRINRYRNLKYL